jgi:hypothetical protein
VASGANPGKELMTSRSVHVHVSGTSGPKRAKVRVGYADSARAARHARQELCADRPGSYIVNAQSIWSDREISDRDLRAVYEYLCTIRARPDIPNSGF